MGTFEIKSSSLNNSYEYKNESVTVQGNYSKDATTGTVQNVSGSVYKAAQEGQGEYIGNFNGYANNGEILYTLSQMSRRNSNLTWDAIDEIEPNITGENEE